MATDRRSISSEHKVLVRFRGPLHVRTNIALAFHDKKIRSIDKRRSRAGRIQNTNCVTHLVTPLKACKIASESLELRLS